MYIKYRKNVQIWSIVIDRYKHVERRRQGERGRDRYIDREKEREKETYIYRESKR